MEGGGSVMAKTNGIEQPPAPEILDEIRSVISRAKQGDTTVLPRLRELLADHPALWQRYGDLAVLAEAAWADLAAGTDLHLRESLLRRAEALREELAGPTPSPVEKLLVERVVATWLQLHYFDVIEAQSLNNDEKPRLASFRAKRQEQAHRMYLTSLAALTTLRKLLPKATMKVLPSPSSKADTTALPVQNGHGNGHVGGVSAGVHNRIGIYFDEPALAATNGHREPNVAGVGVED
jgi:hypothetical protein